MLCRTTSLLVLATVFSMVSSELKLMLLHTNDMHARFQETDAHSGQCRAKGSCYGGFARVRGAVDHYRREARQEGRSSLFLNAGDNYQGSAMFTMLKWKVVSELINLMDLDVMSLGNHEFDDGPEGLSPFLTHSDVPVVCCNVDFSQEPALKDPVNRASLSPSKVLTVNGVKVGIIGYLTPETKFISSVGGVRLFDEVEEIKKEAQRLKEEGVKILIALGHSGYTRDKQIAELVPGLDLVIGGHTNTFLYNGNPPDKEKPEGTYPTVVNQPSGRKVLVLQAYAYTKYLGVLRVTFDDEGEVVESSGNPILLDHTFEKNITVDEAVMSFASQVGEATGRKVGTSRAFLESDQPCRIKECNFGNLVTDAMIYSNAKDYFGTGWTNAPVAFVQGGSLRASISPDQSGGEIKYADILLAIPFLNSVERLKIKGSVLRDVLEHSVANYSTEERPGGFLQFSGIQVIYDLTKPPHQRVAAASVRCDDCPIPHYQPLDPDHDYNVLTNSFIADGGDGYLMLRKATERVTMAFTDVDALVLYLEKMSPVYPEVNNRIRFTTDVVKSNLKGSGGLVQASFILITAAVATSLKLF